VNFISCVLILATSFCRSLWQHPLAKLVGKKKATKSFQSQQVYHISVAFLRLYYKGVQRKETTVLDQCPFSTDKVLEDSHLKSLEALAMSNQQKPRSGVLMTTLVEDTPVATFVNYVDFSSEPARDARVSQLAMDVSSCLGPQSNIALRHCTS
jgi:hypothetical protein